MIIHIFGVKISKNLSNDYFILILSIKMSLILGLLKQSQGIHHTSKEDYHLSSIFYYKQKAYIFAKLRRQLQNQMVGFKVGEIIYSCRRIFAFSKREIESLGGILIQMGQNSIQEAQNHRFIGFQIDNYPFLAQKELVLAPVLYGSSVFEIYGEYIKQRIVSNCFILNNQVFYFINNEQDEQKFPLSEVKQQINGKTCGIKILFGAINICVPFQYIFEGIKPSLRVKKEIMGNMEKVVYVRYQNSHCSGFLTEKNKVITVRHIFSNIPQQDAVVYVRVYPYLKERKAKIQLLPKMNIDVIIFKLIQEGQEDSFISDKYTKQQQSVIIHQQSKKLHQGQKIYCMGFGKYSYHNFMFSKFDLVLPTITQGIISKIIDFSGEQVYFKTDSYLYNGFSGTPIWSNQKWIGLSIFILKNSNNSIKYPRHNFSYSSRFIEKYICSPTPPKITPSFESNLTFFQGIQTRHQLIPKL